MDNNDENNFDEPIDENEEKRVKKDIEVITGDGDNLEISPVYSHIKIDKPDVNRNRNKQIIIPNAKEENNDDSDDSQDEENSEEAKKD